MKCITLERLTVYFIVFVDTVAESGTFTVLQDTYQSVDHSYIQLLNSTS